ncbi:GGDEF domain-containing protein [Thalassotalea piscium]|uniref:diguanylate cyclase n=1 Tax=Thalassotalea piscium TaxID=1230533 RepID=A0A7X0TTD0_9GAMM|nr:GGDEF domain-containing protein [Thalassotalea piscium]MBB6542999.1 diguanylate cyclase (GGDEF)-like protein [Thalassotalea piscium]
MLASTTKVLAAKNTASLVTLQTIAYQEQNTITHSAPNNMLDSKVELEVRPSIFTLIDKMKNNDNVSHEMLSQIESELPPLNAAEYYLLNYLSAYISYHNGEIQKAINWANKAISYEEQMLQSQLATPLFFDIYLALAKYHSELGQYKRAYDAKRSYMNRYSDSLMNMKDSRIKALDEKYGTAIKQNENLLLESQNELKRLKIKEAENEKYIQLRNLVILSLVGLLFLALILRQVHVSNRLRVIAKTDALTGLFNRRSLFKKGNLLVNEAVKEGNTVSAILLDIDFFKSVNDNYGHDVGDKVIKMVAEVGTETIRSRDYYARLGGEEFAAILPGASLEESKAFAERLREKVEQLDLSTINIERKITVSIGVANLAQVTPSFDILLHAADEAMYNAKEQGRNRVCCYQPSETTAST